MLKEWNIWKKCIQEKKTHEKCREYYTKYLQVKSNNNPSER